MRALVLSGGGAKGAFQIGVLKKWIQEEGREYDILCGVSVGALNAAFLAQAPMGQLAAAYGKLAETWLQVNSTNVRKSWFFGRLSALWKSSVYDSAPLAQWVARDLDPRAVRASGRKLRVVGSPMKLSRTPAEIAGPPPELGEHTSEILREVLKLSDAELEALIRAGTAIQG